MSKPMPILDYINRMNQIYGNDTQVASITDAPFMAPELQEDMSPMPNMPDLIREEGIQVGPQVKAPIYNTQQYLQGGRVGYKPGGIVEPGVTHYGKVTRESTYHTKAPTGGGVPADDAKKAYIRKRAKQLKMKEPNFKDFTTRGYPTSMKKEQQIAKGYDEVIRKGSAKFPDTPKRTFTLKEKNLIKKNFKGIDFKLGSYGVKYSENKKLFQNVVDFVERGFVKSTIEKLPSKDRKEIIEMFGDEWGKPFQFDDFRYGIPDSAGKNKNIAQRIRAYSQGYGDVKLTGPSWIRKPEGAILAAMKRVPDKYEEVLKDGRLAGYKNLETGETYFHKNYTGKLKAKEFNITNHPDYDKTLKFYNIAKEAKMPPTETIYKLFAKAGFDTKGLRFNDLLRYLTHTTDFTTTANAIEIHHTDTVAGKLGNLQILRADLNKLADTETRRILKIADPVERANKIKLINTQFKEKGIRSVLPDGTVLGVRKESAAKGLERIQKFVIEGGEVGGSLEKMKQVKGIKDWEAKDFKKFNTYLQEFCGYGKSGGGRIGFSKGSCPTNVAQRNFLMATDDVAKGKVTGKAAEQIVKNAGKVAAKAGSKSALASMLGISGFGLDIAYEVASIGTDMAMDSNVTLKGALQNNWLTGFFMKGTGQEEYHKGLYKNYPEAKPLGTAMDLYARIEEEEKTLKRMTTGSDRATTTEAMLNAQKQKIADLSSFFDKLARKEGGRYLVFQEGSPEQVAYKRATQEHDSIGAARTSQGQDDSEPVTEMNIYDVEGPGKYTSKAKGPTLLKKTSKAGFEDSLKTSRTKPYEDYGKTLNPTYGVKHTYGNISKKEIDKMLKAHGDEQGYGWTPYGLGYGMEQRYTQPGIGDRKYNEDLAYRQLAEDITNTRARSAIADFGGVANMAAGGRIGFKAGGFDKGRRAFLKWLAGITGAGVAAGTGFIKLGKGAKTVAPQVTEEVIKRGADGTPLYIADLIKVVKAKGIKKIVDSNINKFPDTVHSYKGVEVIDEVGGTTRIKKQHEGGGQYTTAEGDVDSFDGISHEIEMEIRPQYREQYDPDSGVSWYTNEKGRKVYETKIPDEYTEATVRPDMDGKMKDLEEFIDDADHLELKKIADEGTYDTSLPDIDDID